MSEKMELADDISTQDAMREMGQLVNPVQEALRRMLHEFGDEHYHTCPADNDSGPCDCFAGNLIIKAKTALLAALRASPAEGEAYPSVEAMKAAVELEIHAALGRVQTVAIGQMIQKAIDAAAPPRAAVSPPQREGIRQLFEDHYWDSFQSDRDLIMKHVDAILALYPAGDGREADSLSGEKGKPE